MVPLKPSSTPNERYYACIIRIYKKKRYNQTLTVNYGFGSDVIYLLLSRVQIEYAVERELLLPEGPLILLAQVESNILLIRVERQAYLSTHLNLTLVEGADTRDHDDVASLDLDGLAGRRHCTSGGERI